MIQGRRKIRWTDHAQLKMRQYGLSKGKLMHLLQRPERKEAGIVPGTLAVMAQNKTYSKAKAFAKKPSGEIWLMYKDQEGERTIISAWRYPGISKPGESIPVPEDIRAQVMELQHKAQDIENL